MRFFASWWERVPMRQIGAVVAVVAVFGLLSVQFGAGARPLQGRNVALQLMVAMAYQRPPRMRVTNPFIRFMFMQS